MAWLGDAWHAAEVELQDVLDFEDLPALVSLEGFSSLTIVDRYLNFLGLDALASLDGFGSVETVGSLTIGYNDALVEVTGLDQLLRVRSHLSVIDNPVLEDISGLMGIDVVGEGLAIEDNTALATSDAEALVAAIGKDDIGGTVNISGNAK